MSQDVCPKCRAPLIPGWPDFECKSIVRPDGTLSQSDKCKISCLEVENASLKAELLTAEARGKKRGREEENGACAALVSLCATTMMSADDTVTAILSRMADKESGKSVEHV